MGSELTYGMAAGAGLASFLSPCVLPIVPAYLSFVAGASLDELSDAPDSDRALARRAVVSAVVFVLGFSTVFVALGASASAFNAIIVANLGILSTIAGIIITLMGLHYMGLLRIPLLYREARFHPARLPGGPAGAFLAGLAFAFGWTPCIGPILATILTVAAARDSLSYGVSLLGVYALGLGIPFILAAFALRPFMGFMKRFRRHIRTVEIVTGGMLVATGVLIFTGELTRIANFLLEAFPALATLG